MCNGQHQYVFGIIHLYRKKVNKEIKKEKKRVKGPIADLTSSILYLSCCVFNIIRLDLKYKST
jgi:sRNA-binding protein